MRTSVKALVTAASPVALLLPAAPAADAEIAPLLRSAAAALVPGS
jgi:hypothetical protein